MTSGAVSVPDSGGTSAREQLGRSAAALGGRPGGDAAFFLRLGYRYGAIRDLFSTLYSGKAGDGGLFERLQTLLLEKYRERPDRLKAIDLERERRGSRPDPRSRGPWYLEPGLTAYMLYLDCFAGTLRGFRERIPYLEELGVRLVHFMPFFRTHEGKNDGGFAVSDYLGVDPRCGTNEELVEIAEKLHDRGMYLAADLALNHSADDHPWALAAKSGDERCRGYYYVFPDRREPDRFEAAMPQVFPETAPGNFTRVPEMGAWVMTVFHDFQWDLNWSNPELFLEMLAVLLGLANMGIDLIRLDAVPYLWKEAGTSCQNLPQAHAIVRLLKACADVVAPGVAFLAEAIVQPSEIVKYLDSGGIEECQVAYHASLMALLWEALATRKTGLLAASFGEEVRLPENTGWLSYARCHDDIGLGYDDRKIERAGFTPGMHRRFLLDFYTGIFPGSWATGRRFMENPATGEARISGTCASLCGLESALASGDALALELAIRRIELLYALISSLVGIPMVFSGDELALRNDYSWENDPELAEDNRWMHRPAMDWAVAERRHAEGTIEARIFSHIRRCFAVRRGIPAFAQDALFDVLPSPAENVLVCSRRPKDGSGSAVLVLANFALERRQVPCSSLRGVDLRAARDLLGDAPLVIEGDAVVLGAYGVVWMG